ncbi:MAG: hypothetical protein Q8929_17340, partial [Bacillota bacterium]|nr:hypothetical protein [Bacillota bacterium]
QAVALAWESIRTQLLTGKTTRPPVFCHHTGELAGGGLSDPPGLPFPVSFLSAVFRTDRINKGCHPLSLPLNYFQDFRLELRKPNHLI